MLIAAADGNIDKKEIVAFMNGAMAVQQGMNLHEDIEAGSAGLGRATDLRRKDHRGRMPPPSSSVGGTAAIWTSSTVKQSHRAA